MIENRDEHSTDDRRNVVTVFQQTLLTKKKSTKQEQIHIQQVYVCGCHFQIPSAGSSHLGPSKQKSCRVNVQSWTDSTREKKAVCIELGGHQQQAG